MGIANYTNLSELMNVMLKKGSASISDLVDEAWFRGTLLASEGTLADRGDLENGFIALVDAHYRAGAIRPEPADEMEAQLIRLYDSGKLAENGYGGREGDEFLNIKWAALRELPVIVNINL